MDWGKVINPYTKVAWKVGMKQLLGQDDTVPGDVSEDVTFAEAHT